MVIARITARFDNSRQEVTGLALINKTLGPRTKNTILEDKCTGSRVSLRKRKHGSASIAMVDWESLADVGPSLRQIGGANHRTEICNLRLSAVRWIATVQMAPSAVPRRQHLPWARQRQLLR